MTTKKGKDTYYFSHDYNARSDPKIKRLLSKLGITGYGVYWAIVEDLYNNANALPSDYGTIAYDLRCEVSMIKSIIEDFDLFEISGEYFGSPSVERRLNKRSEKSSKARLSAQIRWNKIVNNDADAKRTHTDCNAIKGKERKGKEINKESIEKETVKRFLPPSVEEVKNYVSEKGYTVDPESFVAFYSSKNWYIGTNKMKDWRAAIITWEKRNNTSKESAKTNNVNEIWKQ